MKLNLKNRLGILRRGVSGIIQNNFEKNSDVSREIQNYPIGKSAGGLEINLLEIGNGPRKILLVAGTHGNEVGTVKLARNVASWLNIDKENFPDLSFYIIPCLNPDGYASAKKNPNYFGGGKIGRFNKNRVDLNRNFPVLSFKSESFWYRGKNYAESEKVYCGPNGASESEAQALIKIIQEKEIKIVFSFHSVGSDVISNSDSFAKKIANIYARNSGFRLLGPECNYDRDFSGWMGEWCDQCDISYIEIEGSTRWGSDWKKQSKAIEASLNYIKNSN
ncbi:MAG: M14 family zinc carboxypeptidase [Parcubacteria group bacterium]|jgi:murein tripeptide amidase MpaA